jgi:mannose-6-phosphate isomerase-like protein (cupin superfamily)
MRKFVAVTVVVLSVSALAVAQQRGGRAGAGGGRGAAPAATDPTVGTQMTAAQLADAIAKLGNDRPNSSARVFTLAPYSVNVEHRTAQPQTASVHEDDAELFYVINGSETIVTGGKLVDETRNGSNLSGKSIEGGTPHKLSKGDFLMVPKGVPHWISQVDPPAVDHMSIHLPMPK